MSQPGQDAKFFTRGKIEVRHIRVIPLHPPRIAFRLRRRPGISCRLASSRNQRQEVREKENCS